MSSHLMTHRHQSSHLISYLLSPFISYHPISSYHLARLISSPILANMFHFLAQHGSTLSQHDSTMLVQYGSTSLAQYGSTLQSGREAPPLFHPTLCSREQRVGSVFLLRKHREEARGRKSLAGERTDPRGARRARTRACASSLL